jgi:hypothetical protein
MTFLLLLSLAINAAVLATIGYHYYRNTCLTPSVPCPLSPRDAHLYQSLGLSAVQLSKMEPLAQKFHGRLAQLQAALEGKRGLLINLLQRDSDPATIETLRREMAGIQDEVQKEVIVHIMESKKILGLDQQYRFFDLMHQTMAGGKGPWSPTSGGK